jgi:tRNA pseudouridine38-40 synthase
MPRYAFELEFDGRHFQGTQSQRQGATLQRTLSEALTALDGRPVAPRLASRLDAGVSAERLPADAWLERAWEPRELIAALNARLPREAVAARIACVAEDFHSQHDAQAKRYRYEIARRATRPVLETRATWVRRIDHPQLLAATAELLIGNHDLSGFACLRRDGTDEDDPVREVLAAGWVSATAGEGEAWTFRITGTGFLYKQIRGMVGAMVAVAQGRRSMADFTDAIARGRAAAKLGNIAPAHGLVLELVGYSQDPGWITP